MHTIKAEIESGRAGPQHLPKRKIIDVEVVAAWVVAACLLVGLILV